MSTLHRLPCQRCGKHHEAEVLSARVSTESGLSPQRSPHFAYANKPLNSLACDTAVANAAMSGASLCSGMLGMSS